MTDPGPCELRRLVGERGCGALSMGGFSTRVGVEGFATGAVALLAGSPSVVGCWVLCMVCEGCRETVPCAGGAVGRREEEEEEEGAFAVGEDLEVGAVGGAK